MLNARQHTDIFFSYKPSGFLYALSNIKEKIQSAPKSIETLFIALNVGCNKDDTSYISSPEKRGFHWSLLVVNIKQDASLYCDSKGWPVPINIDDTVGCNLAMIEADYGLFIMKNVHNVPPASPTHSYMAKCRAYYPWQSCSYMCGVIVICMTAVMSLNWDSWASWDCRSTPPIISKNQGTKAHSNVLDH